MLKDHQCLHYGPDFRTLVRIRTFLGKVVRKWSGFTVKVRILSSWESKPPGSCYFCSQLRSTGAAHNYIITAYSTVFSVISLKYIQFEQEKAMMIQSKSNYLLQSVRIWSGFHVQIVHHLGEIHDILNIQHPAEVYLGESAFKKSSASKISNIQVWCVFHMCK